MATLHHGGQSGYATDMFDWVGDTDLVSTYPPDLSIAGNKQIVPVSHDVCQVNVNVPWVENVRSMYFSDGIGILDNLMQEQPIQNYIPFSQFLNVAIACAPYNNEIRAMDDDITFEEYQDASTAELRKMAYLAGVTVEEFINTERVLNAVFEYIKSDLRALNARGYISRWTTRTSVIYTIVR